MRNLILKQGDLVRYHYETPELDAMGFVLGQSYGVTKIDTILVVESGRGTLTLVNPLNELSVHAESFKLDRSTVLPKGRVS